MPDDLNYTPGALLAWHQPERYQLYAHCVRCHHEAELYIPRLMQEHRLPDHMPMERVRSKLRCARCGQTVPKIRKAPIGKPHERR